MYFKRLRVGITMLLPDSNCEGKYDKPENDMHKYPVDKKQTFRPRCRKAPTSPPQELAHVLVSQRQHRPGFPQRRDKPPLTVKLGLQGTILSADKRPHYHVRGAPSQDKETPPASPIKSPGSLQESKRMSPWLISRCRTFFKV